MIVQLLYICSWVGLYLKQTHIANRPLLLRLSCFKSPRQKLGNCKSIAVFRFKTTVKVTWFASLKGVQITRGSFQLLTATIIS